MYIYIGVQYTPRGGGVVTRNLTLMANPQFIRKINSHELIIVTFLSLQIKAGYSAEVVLLRPLVKENRELLYKREPREEWLPDVIKDMFRESRAARNQQWRGIRDHPETSHMSDIDLHNDESNNSRY